MRRLLEKLFRLANGRQVKALDGIPGPAPLFPFGNALDFRTRQPWEVFADYGRRYGGLTLVWLFNKPLVVLNDPTLIGEVLADRQQRFYKEDPRQALAPIITPFCLFISNEPEWERRRAAHPFSMPGFDAWLADRVPTLRDAALTGLDRLALASQSGPLNLTAALQRFTFDLFAAAVFGEAFSDDDYARFELLGRAGDRRMQKPIPFLYLPLGSRFARARRLWYEKFSRLIAAAQRDPDPAKNDLLRVLVRRGTVVEGEEFRALAANVFYGGVYSATSCLATTLYLLARHPDIAAALRDETQALFQRQPSFDWTALDACPLLDAVLRESLRYWTPVPMFARNVRTTQPVELAGQTIPADTVIVMTNTALHRAPSHWQEPDRFNPSRWLNGGAAANPLGSGYFFPFGRGPRSCIGMPFALFYLKLTLAACSAQARWELDPKQFFEQSYFFGVMLPKGLRARVART